MEPPKKPLKLEFWVIFRISGISDNPIISYVVGGERKSPGFF